MKKDIVIIVSAMNLGGAQRVVSILCNHWSQNDYKVTLISTFTGNTINHYQVSQNVSLMYLSESPFFPKNKLFNKPMSNKPVDYKEALTGTLECSTLSKAFFSKQNMQIIQNSIRATVYARSNNQHIIGQQDTINLQIIMRSIFLQYTRSISTNITQQISDLNNLVVNFCVPKILPEIDAYIKYKNDVSTLVVPLDRPVQTDFKFKSNEFKRFF